MLMGLSPAGLVSTFLYHGTKGGAVGAELANARNICHLGWVRRGDGGPCDGLAADACKATADNGTLSSGSELAVCVSVSATAPTAEYSGGGTP